MKIYKEQLNIPSDIYKNVSIIITRKENILKDNDFEYSINIRGNLGNLSEIMGVTETTSVLLSLVYDEIQDEEMRDWVENFMLTHRPNDNQIPTWMEESSYRRESKGWSR